MALRKESRNETMSDLTESKHDYVCVHCLRCVNRFVFRRFSVLELCVAFEVLMHWYLNRLGFIVEL
jgi:hypothetical protein